MINFYAPEKVWERLADKTIEKNGCGAGWTASLIPDRWFGLDFTMPCAIHDEMYALGITNEDKEIADRVFYNNMLRVVETRPKCLQFLGRRLALRYYQAVRDFGSVAYWSGKNNPEEMRTAIVDTTIKGIRVIKTIKAIV